ncbi:MAG TPA: hypothetical protein DEA75_12965 [Rhodobacteraceae bacterium]|nr:hypothetical protein [Paracoccaceae bacterium]
MVTIRHAKIFNIAVDGNAAIGVWSAEPKLNNQKDRIAAYICLIAFSSSRCRMPRSGVGTATREAP